MVTSATYRQSSTPAGEDPGATTRTTPSSPGCSAAASKARPSATPCSPSRAGSTPGSAARASSPTCPRASRPAAAGPARPPESDRNRRSIYVFVRRNLKYPLFDAFDAPDTNTTCPERNVTVNAPQALMLLNSDLVLDQARALAGRVLAAAGDDRHDPKALVSLAYRFALEPRPEARRAVPRRRPSSKSNPPSSAPGRGPQGARPPRPHARRLRPRPGRGPGGLLPRAVEPERVRVRRLSRGSLATRPPGPTDEVLTMVTPARRLAHHPPRLPETGRARLRRPRPRGDARRGRADRRRSAPRRGPRDRPAAPARAADDAPPGEGEELHLPVHGRGAEPHRPVRPQAAS